MRKNRKCGEYKTEENQMSFAITMLKSVTRCHSKIQIFQPSWIRDFVLF